MSDAFSSLGSSLSGVASSAFGGATGMPITDLTSGSTGGSSVFDTGAGPFDTFLGMTDPTGSAGATFSQNYGDPTGQIFAGPTQSTNQQTGGDQSAPDEPPTTKAGTYTPAAQPTLPQSAVDPAAWGIGGPAAGTRGPTGFTPSSWLANAQGGAFPPAQPFPQPPQTFPRAQPQAQPQTQTPDQQAQPNAQTGPEATPQSPSQQAGGEAVGKGGGAAAGKPPDQETPDSTRPTPQARGPSGGQPAPAMPQVGGMPGGGIPGMLGNLIGALSGNPQSLLRLIQGFMGGGMPGMGGQPNAPWLPGYGPGMRLAPQDRMAAMQALQRYRQTGQMPGQDWRQQGGAPPTSRGTPPPPPAASGAPPQPGGNSNAPSQMRDGRFPKGYQQVAPIVAQSLNKAGLPSKAVQGIMYNIEKESGYDPTMRHADQPKWSGEAHYAHGLYQEGALNWNRYSKWLGGRDWRDPQLQTEFLAENMQQNYPRLWHRLQNAQSAEEAASLFLQDYLQPARQYMAARLALIRQGMR